MAATDSRFPPLLIREYFSCLFAPAFLEPCSLLQLTLYVCSSVPFLPRLCSPCQAWTARGIFMPSGPLAGGTSFHCPSQPWFSTEWTREAKKDPVAVDLLRQIRMQSCSYLLVEQPAHSPGPQQTLRESISHVCILEQWRTALGWPLGCLSQGTQTAGLEGRCWNQAWASLCMPLCNRSMSSLAAGVAGGRGGGGQMFRKTGPRSLWLQRFGGHLHSHPIPVCDHPCPHVCKSKRGGWT